MLVLKMQYRLDHFSRFANVTVEKHGGGSMTLVLTVNHTEISPPIYCFRAVPRAG